MDLVIDGAPHPDPNPPPTPIPADTINPIPIREFTYVDSVMSMYVSGNFVCFNIFSGTIGYTGLMPVIGVVKNDSIEPLVKGEIYISNPHQNVYPVLHIRFSDICLLLDRERNEVAQLSLPLQDGHFIRRIISNESHALIHTTNNREDHLYHIPIDALFQAALS